MELLCCCGHAKALAFNGCYSCYHAVIAGNGVVLHEANVVPSDDCVFLTKMFDGDSVYGRAATSGSVLGVVVGKGVLGILDKIVSPDKFKKEVEVCLIEVDDADFVGFWLSRLFFEANCCCSCPAVWDDACLEGDVDECG